MEVVLSIDKKCVMREVAKTTSYVGGNIDAATYDRVATTDENEEILNNFWADAKAACCQALNECFEKCEELETGKLNIYLELPSNWKMELKDVMQQELCSYFESFVEARWFGVVLKEEAPKYEGRAGELLLSVQQAMYERNRPKRSI